MSSKKVLIVEQDSQLAQQMSAVLAKSGYETVVHEDGVAGLQAARDLLPAAIVLCVEVPKMSGFAVCHKMKKMPELQNIPLMLTSAEATVESFAKHKELKTRADAFLIIPYDWRASSGVRCHVGGGGAAADLELRRIRRHSAGDTTSIWFRK
jgi:DNA-binding response OmpR family regulator